jgi:sugar phosphate isomerase/epimerase
VTVRTAFYTYSYIDRLGMEPAEVLPLVAAAGYEGVDLSATWRADLDPVLFPPERRREVKELAARLGLRIEALVTHLPMLNALWAGDPINLPGAVDLAVELGCPVVTVHVGSPAQAGHSEAEGWDLAVGYLREVCAHAAPCEVTVCLDAVFPGFLTDTPEKVVRLIEAVGSDHLRHNLDPCYLAVAGFDLTQAVPLLAPWTAHVHVKDHVGHWPQWEHRIPGDGELDHGTWLRALAAAGYSGALAIECFTDHPLPEAIRRGWEMLAGQSPPGPNGRASGIPTESRGMTGAIA